MQLYLVIFRIKGLETLNGRRCNTAGVWNRVRGDGRTEVYVLIERQIFLSESNKNHPVNGLLDIDRGSLKIVDIDESTENRLVKMR